ncbi:hypothetical protein BU25DRAFT_464600 [Macroventuria anomochaeta]|uniref:Uncharacterized protein n=1 Tax=Macroventuria anomochaeta TaxID=301207 RepID=A0ACB6SJ87_9PLEO|nr:uncharacterized protein BU25DRAFT_464600 [Macroventuria anomochaeta]KAF2633489.1 hypothetical protein BU25DRAFT_464600 [Macroventuria anomochaeta]
MHLSSTFIAGLLLASAEGVLGGSRFWEAKAPNKRTNPSPDYAAIETLNATSRLVKRAISIENRADDNSVSRIWPNKKIKYCFEDKDENTNVIIRGLWKQARDLWAPLIRHGFSYEEVSDSVCESQRSTVLRIHYNDKGRLASTLGIPNIDEAANEADPENAIVGPYTHLSDTEGIGQDDIAANVAHELGHVWGLLHEHQNPYYWRVSPSDSANGWSFPSVKGATTRFQTSGFNCQSLKDHDTAHASVRTKIATAIADGNRPLQVQLETDLSRLCISQVVAGKHKFSAAEWLPLPNTVHLVADDQFDPDSLMMYPSGAGGTGSGDGRAQVMVYENNDPIPNRLAPSGMDVDRLITLYGTPASSTTGEPYTSKSSKVRSGFKKARSMLFRAGDTKAGLC